MDLKFLREERVTIIYGCNIADFEVKNSTEGWGGKIAILYRGKIFN